MKNKRFYKPIETPQSRLYNIEDIQELYNKYNNGIPYHNFDHVYSTGQRALYLLSLLEDNKSKMFEEELFLSCLFHDLGYSLESKSDYENISKAIELYKVYAQEKVHSKEVQDLVIKLIKATEFPHKKSNLSTLEYIIQDADVTQVWEENNNVFLDGLRKEYEIRNLTIPVTKTFPDIEMLNLKVSKEIHKKYLSEIQD